MTTKVLCICDGGNIRSVTLAQFIKGLNGRTNDPNLVIKYEAIAIGEKYSTKETMDILRKWADKVIDTRKYFPKDIWHNSRDTDLVKKVKQVWKKENEN